MIFKVMKLDELSQEEWAERKHGPIPSPEKYIEIMETEQ